MYAGTTGKISGSVLDENNGPLIGCNIIVKGTSLGAATDLNGRYFILNVPPGVYEISSSMIGYGTVTIKGTQVIVDLTAKADFILRPETIEGEEIVSFDNHSDLEQKIEYYLANPVEREKIAEAGYKKVYQHHTYNNRVNEIMNKLKKEKFELAHSL